MWLDKNVIILQLTALTQDIWDFHDVFHTWLFIFKMWLSKYMEYWDVAGFHVLVMKNVFRSLDIVCEWDIICQDSVQPFLSSYAAQSWQCWLVLVKAWAWSKQPSKAGPDQLTAQGRDCFMNITGSQAPEQERVRWWSWDNAQCYWSLTSQTYSHHLHHWEPQQLLSNNLFRKVCKEYVSCYVMLWVQLSI